MNKSIVKCVIALSLTIVVTGCKLAVIVVEGGEVQSIASGTCQPTAAGVTGNVCIHQIADTNYSEAFTAVPDAGWHFVRWNSGDGFLCSDSTDPTCVTSNTLLAGNPLAEAIVASSQTYYLMPVFTDQLPITDTVVIDGQEWAQVDLFDNLSWNQINAVCAGGPCAAGVALNGYDMTGWTWASVEDMNALFNYFGAPLFGSEPGEVVQPCEQTSWAGLLVAAGFRPVINIDNAYIIFGLTREATTSDSYRAWATYGGVFCPQEPVGHSAGTNWLVDKNAIQSGAWFYRTP